MRSYRAILSAKLKEAGLNQRQIAKAMGWSNQATVSLRLSGKRDWGEGELQRICELAGVTVLWLSENSDDLVLADNKKSVTIAALADKLSDEQRDAVISLIRSMNPS